MNATVAILVGSFVFFVLVVVGILIYRQAKRQASFDRFKRDEEALQVARKARMARVSAESAMIGVEAERRRLEALDKGISRERLREIDRELDKLLRKGN